MCAAPRAPPPLSTRPTRGDGRAGLSGVAMKVAPQGTERRLGGPVTVTLAYHPTSAVPILGALAHAVTLRAAVTMRVEEP